MTNLQEYVCTHYSNIGQGYLNGISIPDLATKISELEPWIEKKYTKSYLINAVRKSAKQHPKYEIAKKEYTINKKKIPYKNVDNCKLLEIIIFKQEADTQWGLHKWISKALDMKVSNVEDYVKYAKRWGFIKQKELKTISKPKPIPKTHYFNWNQEKNLGLGKLPIYVSAYLFNTLYNITYEETAKTLQNKLNKEITQKQVESKLKRYKKQIKSGKINQPSLELELPKLEEIMIEDIDILLSA